MFSSILVSEGQTFSSSTPGRLLILTCEFQKQVGARGQDEFGALFVSSMKRANVDLTRFRSLDTGTTGMLSAYVGHSSAVVSDRHLCRAMRHSNLQRPQNDEDQLERRSQAGSGCAERGGLLWRQVGLHQRVQLLWARPATHRIAPGKGRRCPGNRRSFRERNSLGSTDDLRCCGCNVEKEKGHSRRWRTWSMISCLPRD